MMTFLCQILVNQPFDVRSTIELKRDECVRELDSFKENEFHHGDHYYLMGKLVAYQDCLDVIENHSSSI